jgi:hypothetical protein
MAQTGLQQRRWFPTGQPQTLQIAVVLLYWNAALSLLFGLFAGGFGRLELVLLALDLAGGLGIANERKWGYVVAVAAALLPLVLLIALGGLFAGGLLNLIFQIALVFLLLHPMSRNYFKLWFR